MKASRRHQQLLYIFSYSILLVSTSDIKVNEFLHKFEVSGSVPD